jgi:hypothetical protein
MAEYYRSIGVTVEDPDVQPFRINDFLLLKEAPAAAAAPRPNPALLLGGAASVASVCLLAWLWLRSAQGGTSGTLSGKCVHARGGKVRCSSVSPVAALVSLPSAGAHSCLIWAALTALRRSAWAATSPTCSCPSASSSSGPT